MGPTATLILLSLVLETYAQNIGTLTAEVHPSLAIQQCTLAQGCQTIQKSVVLDANLRWTHRVDGYADCYTGNTWDPVLCDNNPILCAQSCAVDGADYSATYGITTSGTSISLRYVTEGQYQRNVGSRVFLLDDDNNYMQFRLANREFTFDVDISQMPCGTNGALYFVDMHRDGGLSAFPDNRAGARYGTGYCDSQCPRELKWIDGEVRKMYSSVYYCTHLTYPRRILSTGPRSPTRRVKDTMGAVARKWTCCRGIRTRLSGRRTRAPVPVPAVARTWSNAATGQIIPTMALATRMGANSTRIVWEIPHSTAPMPLSTPTSPLR